MYYHLYFQLQSVSLSLSIFIPSNLILGLCGSGKGEDTYTSGFELVFTSQPTSWDNEYFKNLVAYNWSVHKGPGNHYQWSPDVDEGLGLEVIKQD